MAKKYYWLKLQEDFFSSKRIKKLRKLAGGDTYTIIYLKMQLIAMKNGGILEYTGLEPTFAEELALDLDEEADNVSITVNYLLNCGLLETSNNIEYFVPYAVANTGSEGASADRMRKLRERKASQCDVKVTTSDAISDAGVTHALQVGDVEKEKEIEIEKEKDIYSASTDAPPPPKKTKSNKFVKPTVEEVRKYCNERGNSVDPERFVDHYEANGWKIGRNSMKNWKAAVRTWERWEGENINAGNRNSTKESEPKYVLGELL